MFIGSTLWQKRQLYSAVKRIHLHQERLILTKTVVLGEYKGESLYDEGNNKHSSIIVPFTTKKVCYNNYAGCNAHYVVTVTAFIIIIGAQCIKTSYAFSPRSQLLSQNGACD